MSDPDRPDIPSSTPAWAVALAWLVVIVPLLWGVGQTIKKASALFQ
jgi:hypothetical protein